MKTLIIGIIILFGFNAGALELSKPSIFRRCYSLVTQTFPGINNNLYQSVVAGQMDPIEACLSVLDKGQIGANNRVSNTGDQEARNVLMTFHQLHYSWFSVKDFGTSLPDTTRDGTRELYDVSSPAYYYTNALFRSNYQFSSIFTDTNTYGAVRTNMNATNGPYNGVPFSQWHLVGAGLRFVPTGDLLGVQPMAPYVVTNGPSNTNRYGSTMTVFRHFGSGVIGSAPYITQTIQSPPGQRSNASAAMPRKWTQAVFNDLLCRQLPVVRNDDVKQYVVSASGIGFRRVQSCVRCHASMDQMAGLGRNLVLTTYEPGYNLRGAELRVSPTVIIPLGISQPAEAVWPTDSDGNYFRRPAQGRFVFRTYSGELHDKKIDRLSDLGPELVKLDDPYLCAAKRYYRYFLGIDIPIRDYQDPDPASGYTLTDTENMHFQEILRLGQGLKTHQSLRRMVEDILKNPAFSGSKSTIRGLASE